MMQLYISKILCTVAVAFFFIFSFYSYALTYNEQADFSDIFIGYGNATVETKYLQDNLNNDDTGEIIELSTLNGKDFNEIRSLKIGSSDEDYNLSLDKGQNIAQKFLSRVCFLFRHNSTTEKYIIYNSKAISDKELTGAEKEEAVKENEILPEHSCDSINNEQKYFILSIRQAILKIASNPVGRRLLCRIIRNIDTKKILIVQTKHNVTKGSFSFYQGLTTRLADAYVCVTVPWELGKSTSEKPGLGSFRDKTAKQLAIAVNIASDLNCESSIIGQSNTDTKPFYISLCHEFIHCLHFLENKMVDLDESKTNQVMFFAIYKNCLWDKNVPLIFDKINLSYLFSSEDKNYEKEEFSTLSSVIENLPTRAASSNSAMQNIEKHKCLKASILVDNLLGWNGFTNQGSVEKTRIVHELYSELLNTIHHDGGVDTLILRSVMQQITKKYLQLWKESKMQLFGDLWKTNDDMDIVKHNSINSILGMLILRHCVYKLNDNHFFQDYLNGEEIYTVTGLRYEGNKFILDNVSELSFNALENNKVIRISYSSAYNAASSGSAVDQTVTKATTKLNQFIQDGHAKIDAKTILKRLTGESSFDNLKEGELLESELRRKILKTVEDDLFSLFGD